MSMMSTSSSMMLDDPYSYLGFLPTFLAFNPFLNKFLFAPLALLFPFLPAFFKPFVGAPVKVWEYSK